MKFIQTLYICKDSFRNGFGWLAPEYHLMSWALSYLQLKKIYTHVELYANSEAARLLIDCLKLPYYKVHITHDKINLAHESLWAMPKILTYSLQQEPFIHIDGDVFIFDNFPEALIKGNLIAQNFEEATNYYLQAQKELMDHFSYFPACVKHDFDSGFPIKAVNAGILGGNNLDFIKEYTRLAFEYINRNISHFSNINVDRFNIFFEQHLFYSLAHEKGIGIEVLFPFTMKDNQYVHLGDIHEVPCIRSYLHLLGQYKRDEFTCRLMAAKLRQLYPDFYYRIISLFKNIRNPITTHLYQAENLITIKDYENFAAVANESYTASLSDKKKTVRIKAVEKRQINTLTSLKETITGLKEFAGFTQAEIEIDFNTFSKRLKKLLKENRFNETCIYGRDLESVGWFCDVFGKESEIMNKIICKCPEVFMIASTFNWAGLWNKHNRGAVKYYEELAPIPGVFHNIIVIETYGDGFSLHDADELEKMILDNLEKPQSIKNLFESMLDYVEEIVINEHLEEYRKLIILMLKQLVLKKAIKPLRINRASI